MSELVSKSLSMYRFAFDIIIELIHIIMYTTRTYFRNSLLYKLKKPYSYYHIIILLNNIFNHDITNNLYIFFMCYTNVV